MDSKGMSIKVGHRAHAAFTLLELLVASSVAALVSAAIIALACFTARGFVAMTNYTDMALASRMTLDKMAKSIRQMSTLAAYATNSITLKDAAGYTLSYTWDPAKRTLKCVDGGKTNAYLTGCDSLQFWIYQHTPKSNSFDCYEPAYVTNARLVQVTWTCSRQMRGIKANTELVESAKIALRNR
jgi:prepilin-type N-terminal cleavage/methylation domain-containing protein